MCSVLRKKKEKSMGWDPTSHKSAPVNNNNCLINWRYTTEAGSAPEHKVLPKW